MKTDAEERITMAKIEHDIRKQDKGFCSNPFCRYCKDKASGE